MDIIIISSIDWSTQWQMHHQLSMSLINSGNRVLFIENTGIRSPKIKDATRIINRIRSWYLSTKGFRSEHDNLFIYSPLIFPFPQSIFFTWINFFILNRSLKYWSKALNFHEDVIISFLPSLLSQKLIKKVFPKLSIYYCANDMFVKFSNVKKLQLIEDIFFSNVDMVFVISDTLQKRAENKSNSVFYFPPGVDFNKFNNQNTAPHTIPSDIKGVKTTIVGYIGALTEVLDQDLLLFLADELRSVTFILIGPKHCDTRRLEKIDNILLLGKKEHDQIPFYVRSFDVALIPYVCNSFTNSVYPCKLNEYLAVGIPVVSTNLNEITRYCQDYGHVVTIAKNYNEFLKGVKKIKTIDAHVQKRIEAARLNSWDNRFSDIYSIINKSVKERHIQGSNWKNILINYYHRSKTGIRILFFSITASYAIVFYTPFLWYLSNPLISNIPASNSDVIVIFGGHGEFDYKNFSFQDRVKDAIKLYNSGYSDNIIVSSGKTYEITMINALLKDNKVPSSSIIIDKGASNTYKSANQVIKILNNRNWKSALLITSKYHAKRATLVWAHHTPEIYAFSPSLEGGSNNTLKWGATLKEVKVVIYEYTALLYYWIIGRIS